MCDMRIHLKLVLLATCAVGACLLSCPLALAAQETSHARLLPSSTGVAFSIVDFPEWQENIRKTGLSAYFAEDQVRQMIGDIAKVSDDRLGLLTVLRSRLIRKYATGQVTLSIVPGEESTFLILIDCRDENSANECTAAIRQTAKDANLELSVSASGSQVMASNRRFANPDQANSLASSERFIATVGKAAGEVSGSLFWMFVDPLALSDDRDAKPIGNTKLKFPEFARLEKFDTLQALGGVGTVSANNPKMQMLGFIHAQRPFQRGMRMLDLRNEKSKAKPEWLGNGLSHGFLNVHTDRFLESSSTVFDTVVGEGEQGIFEVVLDDLLNDPKGPRVDISNEIMKHLVSPIYFSTLPNTADGQTVFAIQTSDAATVRRAFEKIFAGDPQAKRFEEQGIVGWQVRPKRDQRSNSRSSNGDFAVVLQNGFLIYGPNMKAIQSAWKRSGAKPESWFTPANTKLLGDKYCFAYSCDLRQLIGSRHDELKNGRSAGGLGALLRLSNLDKSLPRMNRSAWPSFESLPNHIRSRLKLLGTTDVDGFKFVVEVVE